MQREDSGTNRTKLIAAYAVVVVIVDLICLLTSNFLPWVVLFLLTLPFSVVIGLVIAGLSHSGYDSHPEIGLLLAAFINCLFLLFGGNRRPPAEEEEPTDKSVL